MMKKQTYPTLALFGIALTAASSQAAITYVDAVQGIAGNTFATGGSLGVETWESGADNSAGNETQWTLRTTVEGNSNTIYQALHEVVNSDDIPELTTQISGLADGTYQIWAFYWDQVVNDGQDWTISTGLTSGSLVSYSSPGEPAVPGAITTGVTDANSLSFTTVMDTIANEGSATAERRMFGVDLGQVTVSGGSSTVNVYVDNLVGNGSNNRTWYDGVGYEAIVIPEPGSMSLLGFGWMALLLRRRR